MRVLWSTYSSRANVSPMVRLAVQLGTLGAAARQCDLPVTTGGCR